MTVTSVLMETGSFNIGLDPATPTRILDALDPSWQLISIYPAHVSVLALPLLDGPIWRGVLLTRSDDGLTIGGADLTWLLGTSDETVARQTSGYGPRRNASWTSASATDFMTGLVTLNGLTPNVVDTLSGTITASMDATIRSALDHLAIPRWACEWRVRPTGVVELYDPANVDTSVVVSSVVGGRSGVSDVAGWHLADADIDRSSVDRRSRWITRYGTAANQGSSTSQIGQALGGSWIEMTGLDSLDTSTGVSAIDHSTAQHEATKAMTVGETIEIDDPAAVPRHTTPDLLVGSTVWVHDPTRGFIGDPATDTPIAWRGSTIYPVATRCVQITWPISPGVGVYMHTKGVPTDLTPYLVWETGTTQMTLGAPPRDLSGKRRVIAA